MPPSLLHSEVPINPDYTPAGSYDVPANSKAFESLVLASAAYSFPPIDDYGPHAVKFEYPDASQGLSPPPTPPIDGFFFPDRRDLSIASRRGLPAMHADLPKFVPLRRSSMARFDRRMEDTAAAASSLSDWKSSSDAGSLEKAQAAVHKMLNMVYVTPSLPTFSSTPSSNFSFPLATSTSASPRVNSPQFGFSSSSFIATPFARPSYGSLPMFRSLHGQNPATPSLHISDPLIGSPWETRVDW